MFARLNPRAVIAALMLAITPCAFASSAQAFTASAGCNSVNSGVLDGPLAAGQSITKSDLNFAGGI